MGYGERRGEITAFLSLVFVLMISFISGILEASVIQTSKSLSRLETDRAVFSIFGEYENRLLEEYHVFAIDSGYGTGDHSEENLVRRMHYYGTQRTEHEISQIQYLTDNSGQNFREQVLAYMEQRYGIGLVRDLTGLTSEWEESQIQENEMKRTEEEQVDQILALEEQTGEAEENPFGCVEKIENAGLLSVVLPDQMTLSGKQVNLTSQVSERSLNTGRGSFPVRSNTDGIEEKLLFNEYILKKFQNAVGSEREREETGESTEEGSIEYGAEEEGTSGGERSLSYEVEYIISGKESDRKNLESVLMKIFLIRLALNYSYILGDEEKTSEAGALATVLSVLILNPELAETIKHLILFAWAVGECVVDIRTLLSGKKVPVTKNRENWQLSLSSLILLGGGSSIEGEDAENGLSYQDYLRIFLFLSRTDQVTMRTIDRVEENLKSEHEMDEFRADHCVTKIEINNTVQIYDELTYKYPVYFGYQ